MSYLLSYKGISLSSLLTSARPTGQDQSWTDGATPRLRQSGSVVQTPRLQETTCSVVAELTAETHAAFLAKIDSVVAVCAGQGNLFYGRDDRYYRNASLLAPAISFPEEGVLYGVYGVVVLPFIAREYPEAFGVAPHIVTLTATGGTIPAQGDPGTFGLPTWTITIAGAGTGPLTLTNTTTKEVCIIKKPGGAPFAAGDVITLDRDTSTAKLNGVAVIGLYDRRIPSVAGSVSNNITLTSGGSASVASFQTTYLPRFR